MPVPQRSRALATATSARISAEAARLAQEKGIPFDEAVAAVFDDPSLLNDCHNVKLPKEAE